MLAHVGSGGRQVGHRGVTGLPLPHSHLRASSLWSHGGPGPVVCWEGRTRGHFSLLSSARRCFSSTRLLSKTSTRLPGTCLDLVHGEEAPSLVASCRLSLAVCTVLSVCAGGGSVGSDSGPRCLSGWALCSPSRGLGLVQPRPLAVLAAST